jgi:hypothetical protein
MKRLIHEVTQAKDIMNLWQNYLWWKGECNPVVAGS